MKKIIVITLALVLCLAVVGTVLALYVKNPEQDLVIQIVSGGKAHLTIGNFTDSTIKPGETIEKHIVLDDNVTETLEGNAILTLEFADAEGSNLAQYLDFTFIEATNAYVAKDGAETVTEATLTTAGVPFEVDTLPHYGILYITINCTDEQFKAVSGDQVNATLNFNYVDWTPVANGWYLMGDYNNWKLDSTTIYLDGQITGDNQCEKTNVYLAAGNYKFLKNNSTTGNIWDGWQKPGANEGDYVINEAGYKDIYLTNDWNIVIIDHVGD